MNTIENNKLLAEFMGVKNELFWFNLKTGNYVKKENTDCEIEQVSLYVKNNKPITSFLYHSDWNWLMQLVEKIETISVFGKLPQFFIMYDNREEFKGWYWLIEVPKKFSKECHNDKNRENTKIEAVYNACIEFVKWHNKN